MIQKYIGRILQQEKEFYQKSVGAFFDRDLGKDFSFFQKICITRSHSSNTWVT